MEAGRTTERMRLQSEEVEIIQQYRGAKDAAKEMGLNWEEVKHGWLKSKNSSIFFKNKQFEMPEFDPDSIDWKKIVANVNEFKTPTSPNGLSLKRP